MMEGHAEDRNRGVAHAPGLDDYGGFMATIPDAALLVDQQGSIVRCNRQAQAMFAAEGSSLRSIHVNGLLPQALREGHSAHMQAFWRDPRQREMGAGGLLMARRLDGSEFPIDIMISPVDLAEGRFAMCVMRDRTRHLEQETRLREALAREQALALTDPLTGAANTRQLRMRLDQEIRTMRRKHRPFTVVYLDLGHFKQVNSRGGHSEGDRALRAVVETAEGALRPTDLLARAGGDEFVIVLPETDSDAAEAIVGRLLDALGLTMARHAWPITFSVGAVTYRQPPASVDLAIQQADDLMFSVKHAGRNDCRFLIMD
jgi:diguanylate cyclase (GGDEF)-like protein/PAS domain S-box-containing protein